jgi:hypothetical protein
MKRDELIKRLTKRATADARAARDKQQALGRNRGPLRPGDLVIVPTRSAVRHWLLVKSHPDDAHIVFAVPADDNPEVGPSDYALPTDNLLAPLTLRAGAGVWLDIDLLETDQRSGTLGEEVLAPVRMLLGRLAAGTLKATPEQLATACHPEYLAWLGALEEARNAVSAWQEETGSVWQLTEVAPEPPIVLRPLLSGLFPSASADAEPAFSMAADDSGLRGELSRHLAAALRPRWLTLPQRGLFLRVDRDGVCAVWKGPARRRPRVQGPGKIGLEDAQWSRHGEIDVSTAWPWSDDRIVLRVGAGQGRKVVIHR